MKQLRKSVIAIFMTMVILITGSATMLSAGAANEETANLALGKTAVASSEYDDAAYAAGKAVDGNAEVDDNGGTRWAQNGGAAAVGSWLYVDLGANYDISKVVVYANNNGQYASYRVQVSGDAAYWADLSTEAVYTGLNDQAVTVRPNTENNVGRYVRVYFIDPTDFATIRELEVYGEATTDTATNYTNVALDKTATSSSEWDSNYSAPKAVDGNLGQTSDNRWAQNGGAAAVGSWLQVDLGAVYEIDQVVVYANYNGQNDAFKIQVSSDGKYWVDFAKEAVYTNYSMDAFSTASDTGNTVAQYVRLVFVSPTDFATIRELEVYGVETGKAPVKALTNVALGKETSSASNYNDGYSSAKAVDGNGITNDAEGTRWAAEQDGAYEGEFLQVDLGEKYDISRVYFSLEASKVYKFKVQISDNGNDWTDYAPEVADLSDNTNALASLQIDEEASARYVRIYFKDGTDFPSIWELEVYGQPHVRFSGASVSLQDDLSINFKADGAIADEYTDLTATFVMNDETVTVTDYTVQNGRLVFDFENIQPDQIGDTITATLSGTSKASGQTEENTTTYSVKQYADNKLGVRDNALNTLLVDMLNYGTSAQNFTNTNTDAPVNGDLTDKQAGFATAERDYVNMTKTAYSTVDAPSVTWMSAGLNLEKSVTMRFKLAADSIDGLSVQVAVGSTDAVAATITDFEATDGGYYVYFNGLNPAQLSEAVYVTAYQNGAAVSNTLRYSVESYVYTVYAQQNSLPASLVALMQDMIKYGDAAKAYIESLIPTVSAEELSQATSTTVTVNTGNTHQTIESFGASGAWWSQMVGGWDNKIGGVEVREQIAKLLFDDVYGIGLNNYRYNIGAGSAAGAGAGSTGSTSADGNLALNKPATATVVDMVANYDNAGVTNGSDAVYYDNANHTADKAVDGNPSTFWAARWARCGSEFVIDLEAVYNINEIKLSFPETAGSYHHIASSVSTDNATWTEFAPEVYEIGGEFTLTNEGIEARYVKLYFAFAEPGQTIGNRTFANGTEFPKIPEIEVYGSGGSASEGPTDDETITDPWRRAETFGVSEGVYDWTRDANAVWFMEKAVEMGVDELVFFANSPPTYLTDNGKAYGSSKNTTNLSSDKYTKFSTYMLDIVDHFVEKFDLAGYNDLHYFVSPVNEPNGSWTSDNGQEGNHYTPSQMVKLLENFISTQNSYSGAYAKKAELSAPELFGWDGSNSILSSTDRYDYLNAIADSSTLKNALKSLDLHSYDTTASQKTSFVSWKNSNMPNVTTKMSEWCDIDADEGAGVNYGMTSALKMAATMHQDLTVQDVVSWQYWTAVSKTDAGWQDCLIYVKENDTTKVVGETKRLWAMGNYSRFIDRGYTRVDASSGNLSVSAYTSEDGNNLVLVLINSNATDYKFSTEGLGDWASASVYVTDATHDLEQTQVVSGGEVLVPAESVVTVTLTK